METSGPPHVLILWMGLSREMLPVKNGGRGGNLGTTTCPNTVDGVKQGNAPCKKWW